MDVTLEIHQLHLWQSVKEAGGPEGVLTTGHGRAQNRGMSTLPMRLLLVVVSASLFLVLAVAARGGIDAFFSQPALIGLTVVLIALCAAALVAGGNLSPGVREDTSNRWVIAVFGLSFWFFCRRGATGGASRSRSEGSGSVVDSQSVAKRRPVAAGRPAEGRTERRSEGSRPQIKGRCRCCGRGAETKRSFDQAAGTGRARAAHPSSSSSAFASLRSGVVNPSVNQP